MTIKINYGVRLKEPFRCSTKNPVSSRKNVFHLASFRFIFANKYNKTITTYFIENRSDGVEFITIILTVIVKNPRATIYWSIYQSIYIYILAVCETPMKALFFHLSCYLILYESYSQLTLNRKPHKTVKHT